MSRKQLRLKRSSKRRSRSRRRLYLPYRQPRRLPRLPFRFRRNLIRCDISSRRRSTGRPNALTDANGALAFDLPLADTITTWKLTALASTRDGDLGAATYDLVVFQDFFVELALPDDIRVGEPLTITATIYNFLPEAQTVSVLPAPDTWYTLISGTETTVMAVDGVASSRIVIRPNERGTFLFRVNAEGAQMGDAVAIEVIIP